jgi:hypothetical protein
MKPPFGAFKDRSRCFSVVSEQSEKAAWLATVQTTGLEYQTKPENILPESVLILGFVAEISYVYYFEDIDVYLCVFVTFLSM